MIDLHLHFDGSLLPRTILDLAKEQGVELPAQELPGVKVENVHFADSLLTLSYMISEGHI